jgi:hypothetical protein
LFNSLPVLSLQQYSFPGQRYGTRLLRTTLLQQRWIGQEYDARVPTMVTQSCHQSLIPNHQGVCFLMIKYWFISVIIIIISTIIIIIISTIIIIIIRSTIIIILILSLYITRLYSYLL